MKFIAVEVFVFVFALMYLFVCAYNFAVCFVLAFLFMVLYVVEFVANQTRWAAYFELLQDWRFAFEMTYHSLVFAFLTGAFIVLFVKGSKG